MPLVTFSDLPDSARVWVFGAEPTLVGAPADTLLAEVDAFLAGWKAHGSALRCARDWRDDRFLTIGVDPTEEQASGCSIDGLFRALQQVERRVGSRLVGGGRVFYRDATGGTQVTHRDALESLVQSGAIAGATPVFDTTLTDLGSWRARFETPASEATHITGYALSRLA